MLANFFSFTLPANQISGEYNVKLVLLSYFIAIIASYVTIEIITNMRRQKANKSFWVFLGAFIMGAGIWSIHFVGMLSFSLPDKDMSYDLFWTLLSLIVSVGASAFALIFLLNKVVKTYQLLLSGLFLGCATASMHYLGMEALREHLDFYYRPLIIVASIVISPVVSTVALWLAIKSSDAPYNKRFRLKLFSAFIIGSAICAMHYTGMAAVVFTSQTHQTPTNNLDHTLLSVAVAAFTFIILIIAFLLSKQTTALHKLQRRLAQEKNSLEETLGAKLQFALDTAKFGSWDLNLATNKIQRTLMHDQIMGYPTLQPEWTPEMFFRLVHPDDIVMVKQKAKEALENTGVIDGRCRIYRANDHLLRWIWTRARFVNVNKTPHLIGLVQDVTDRIIASEKLRLSEERLSILLNSTQEYAIYMVTPEGNISYWNQAAEKILGYKEEEVIGKDISILFLPEDRERLHPEYIRKIAGTVGLYEEKNWRVRKNGNKFFANVIYTRLIDSHKNIIGFCVITRDLTQQELTEKKLQAMAELRKSNEDLEQFAYIASHDLKAPLRAIKNLSKWIQKDKDTALSPASKENFTLLTERISRMENLIEGILQYSKAGLTDKEITSFNLNDLLLDIVASLNPPILFTFVYPKIPIPIRTSRLQLSQVFCNLVDNAIKYHNRKDGRIEFNAKDKGEFYEFSVRDDGPGIKKEFHHKIFELFQTLQSKDVISSSGLGLAIVKKIVELQGGEVKVESNIETGTIFSFTWPKRPILSSTDRKGEFERIV